jgi:hypothetical protein
MADNFDPARELARLRELVLPVMAAASIGDFSRDVEIPQDVSPELKEILAGVQVLIETIREQSMQLGAAQDRLNDSQQRAVGMLDEILRKSFPSD